MFRNQTGEDHVTGFHFFHGYPSQIILITHQNYEAMDATSTDCVRNLKLQDNNKFLIYDRQIIINSLIIFN